MLTITVHGMNNIEKYKITLLHLAGLFFSGVFSYIQKQSL